VDRAESTLGREDRCSFCTVMLSVPAVGACADVGDFEHARLHLKEARRSKTMWEGTAWEAAVAEAEARLAQAEGVDDLAAERLRVAVAGFERAGQPLDVERCRQRLEAVGA